METASQIKIEKVDLEPKPDLDTYEVRIMQGILNYVNKDEFQVLRKFISKVKLLGKQNDELREEVSFLTLAMAQVCKRSGGTIEFNEEDLINISYREQLKRWVEETEYPAGPVRKVVFKVEKESIT